jgi:DNA-binding PadR family transcriptional regulator
MRPHHDHPHRHARPPADALRFRPEGPGPDTGFGPRRGPHGHGPGGGRRGRGPRARGDVRSAVLLLLADEPMHGYQLMQAIADRSGGTWTPSPGAVYPAISLLEDEGLVTVTAESGRKLVALTAAGRDHVESRRAGWPDPFAGTSGRSAGADLRGLLEQVHGAARQVGRTGSEAQVAAAATILGDARRALYLLLAEGPETPDA